jgi:Nif-specific regulatory protein
MAVATGVIGRLLKSVAEDGSVADVTDLVLSKLSSDSAVSGVAVLVASEGEWQTVAEQGSLQAIPWSLLGDVLETDRASSEETWSVAPLGTEDCPDRVLAVCLAEKEKPGELSLEPVARQLRHALVLIEQRGQSARRVERLETILQIAAQWHSQRTAKELFEQMAEAATRLLDSERASVFLWDRPNHELVAMPALGVEGGELRIPDDAGVVGHVVQTGEVMRVDANRQPELINRSVDEELGFQTRSLLCCPLIGRRGQRLGAFEMINKRQGTFSQEDQAALVELAAHAALAVEDTRHLEQLTRARDVMAREAAEQVQLIGESSAIEALRSSLKRVADSDLSLLILGENGTGKEVVSHMIHYHSHRRQQPLVAVNCAALTETLLESELFGHVKGAFTDAHEDREGKFELADGGTLLLDEIGELSPGGQAKLLRVLEEKTVVRVGGSASIRADARVIAATNQNLAEMVRKKRFREDLYYRLNVVTLELPPLRERGDDVILLAEYFLEQLSAKVGRAIPRLKESARKRLRQHNWPGNVRELRNLTERLVYLSQKDEVESGDLDFVLSPDAESTAVSMDLPLGEATRQFQVQYIQKQIQRAGGNMSEAARAMEMHRSNLYRKMRQLGMEGEEEGNEA